MKEAPAPKKSEVVLTDEERAEAPELLRDPRLLDRILEDFVTCGVVGEETNKLVGYRGAGHWISTSGSCFWNFASGTHWAFSARARRCFLAMGRSAVLTDYPEGTRPVQFPRHAC